MKRILVIEDDENNGVLITDLLKHAGYAPLIATTGEDGSAMAESDNPDFILLDIQLPDIDGYAVLERIKTSSTANQIPIIAMTSYATSGDRTRLLAGGCQGYIEKPIDPVNVIRQIQDILEK